MEGEHEAQGLRFWNGSPTVRLLDFDSNLGAMLMERCEPGTSLRALPETEQDLIQLITPIVAATDVAASLPVFVHSDAALD